LFEPVALPLVVAGALPYLTLGMNGLALDPAVVAVLAAPEELSTIPCILI
jgi:hypothetical protein